MSSQAGRPNKGFNGATPFQTWKPLTRRASSCRSPGFNGATPFQTWKHHFLAAPALNVSCASMGPRLFRRGNASRDWRTEPRPSRFNGATPFQTWKRTVMRGERKWKVGFNGATPFQTWKRRLHRPGEGHPGASMGPRLFRRGNGSPASCSFVRMPGFNGATPFQTWKQVVCYGDHIEELGFNGATPFQTWKPFLEGNVTRFVSRASMGPRLFRRGNPTQPESRRVHWRRFNGATPFQTWKHNRPSGLLLRRVSFNGATPFQTWKPRRQSSLRSSRRSFNGATPFQTWKRSAMFPRRCR